MFRGLQMPLCQPRLPLRQIVALDPGKNPIATVSSQDHANEAARRWWQLTWMMKNLPEELRPEERVSKVFHHPHVGIVSPT